MWVRWCGQNLAAAALPPASCASGHMAMFTEAILHQKLIKNKFTYIASIKLLQDLCCKFPPSPHKCATLILEISTFEP